MLGIEGTTVAAVPEHAELLAELRRLLQRFPVPGDDWHHHVAPIRACRDRFEQDLHRAAADPNVLTLLGSLLDGTVVVDFDRGAAAELTAAWDRLADLPLPEGRHPYGDEIAVTIEAMRLLLVALSRTAV